MTFQWLNIEMVTFHGIFEEHRVLNDSYPITIVISTINHSEIGVMFNLAIGYRKRGPHDS